MSDDKSHFCPRCRSPRDPVMRLTTFSCGSRVEPRWESGECLRRRIVILEQENAALVEEVKAHKAVTEDPHALWTNWLRGTVKLPAGIGDVRQLEERVRRLERAGDEMAAWLRNPRNLGDDPFMADVWEATKGQP